jgi:hypothetical protein
MCVCFVVGVFQVRAAARVVSSSGFGDGVYSLQVAEENGEVVAARIVFIDEESDNL